MTGCRTACSTSSARRMLAVTALRPLNLGVVILETIWAGISVGVIAKALARRRAAPGP